MSRERTQEELARARRLRRMRRRRQLGRLRAFLLAAALLAALAVYTGTRTARQPAENSGAASAFHGEAEPPQADGPGGESLPEELEELTSGILADIITEDMTPAEQARAVFDYVHDNIRYTGHSDKSDWVSGACAGLTAYEGDCFTYYAASRALLTALEIDNLPVERVGGETRHYWNLVNCGDGWYHFDACPRSSRLPDFDSFLFTDRQAAEFTAEAGRNYYDFDGSLLPQRASEPMAGE